jgi:hypothetical protein
VLDGGAGNDVLLGGNGNDTLIGGAESQDAADYGDLTLAGQSVTVDLAIGRATVAGGLGEDSLSGIEWVYGGAGNDSIVGDSRSNTFWGLSY